MNNDSGDTLAEAGRELADLWRDTAAWFSSHYWQLLIGLAVGAAIFLLLRFLRGMGKRICAHDPSHTGYRTIFGRAVEKTGNFFIVMVSAKLVSHYARAPDPLASTIDFLFTVAAVFQAAIWARELILGFIEHRTGGANGEHERLGSAMAIIRLLVTVALFAIALIVVLDNLGVNVTGLVAGLGIGGIAIGLAAQGIFSDLFAALSILFDKPFKRGEAIGYDTSVGTVEQIGLKTTRLRAPTGEERIVSNAKLLEKELTNWARVNYRRYKFALGVVYQTSPDKLAQIPEMLRAIVEAEHQLFVRSGFVNFGPSSLDFELEFDAPADLEDAYQARHRIGLAILKRFASEGIEFAYPTQTTFTAAPDGRMVMPYADVQKITEVDSA